jgi:uncharacterized protein
MTNRIAKFLSGCVQYIRLNRLSVIGALAVAIPAPLYAAAGTQCGSAPDLFKAETVVTGLEEAERARGLREIMNILVVKTTGRPELAGGPIAAAFMSSPKRYVAQFCYEDRNRHLKINDEQGTRERPHFLRVSADAERFEQDLAKRGLTVWRNRPSVTVLLTVTDVRGTYAVAEEGPAAADAATLTIDGKPVRLARGKWDGFEVRDTINTFGERHGLTLILPSASESLDLMDPAKCVTYRGALVFGADGLWSLEASVSRATSEQNPPCYRFAEKGASFANLLRANLTSLLVWLRTGEGGSTACSAR